MNNFAIEKHDSRALFKKYSPSSQHLLRKRSTFPGNMATFPLRHRVWRAWNYP